jgi:peroxiredoxin
MMRCFLALLTLAGSVWGQLPAVSLRALDGSIVRADTFSNGGNPIVLSFWATWCKPCLLELNTLHRLYPQWRQETGVKIIAISIDDARTSAKVAPLVRARGWHFEVYLDENGDLRRALNVSDIPHSFVLDGTGSIVWQHQAYAPGDEEEIAQVLRRLRQEGTQPGQSP